MKKSFNDIEDFLTDESFRSWVTSPTPELDSQWAEWIQANSEKQVLVEKAGNLIKSLKFKEFKIDESRKQEIFSQIDRASSRQGKNRTGTNLFYKIAASILIAVGIGTVYYLNIQDVSQQQEVAVTPAIIQKSNPIGMKSQHLLADGSRVFLNSESSIEYPKKFDKDERVVKLDGEAFFQVSHDADRPFRVVVDGLEVEVLGTEFNVNTKVANPEIALVEGKVRLTENENQISTILNPGQIASYNQVDKRFESSPFDIDHITGWKDGVLSFKESSLDEVMEGLHVWYGIEILLRNQPKNSDWSYTANFRNESLEMVLQNMSILRNFDYEIKNDSLIISFR